MKTEPSAGVAESAKLNSLNNAISLAEQRSEISKRIFQALTALLVLIAFGAGAYFYALNNRLIESVATFQQLRETMQKNRELLGLAIDLEASLRGYLLTGDQDVLKRYEEADAALPGQIALLERLLHQRPELLEELRNMKAALDAKREELSKVQALFERDDRRLIRESYWEELGEPETHSLRLSVREIEKFVEQAIREERKNAKRLMRNQSAAIVITLVMVGLIGLISMVLGRRHFEMLRDQSALRMQLYQSQKMSDGKSSFLAQVSHEIRTPMNAILGFSGLLQDRLNDPDNLRYIDSITSSASALLGVVDDLLDYSAIEAGRLGLAIHPTDMREVVDAVVSLLSPQAIDKGLSLSLTVNRDVPSALLLDANRVRQMLMNLIGNAIKYTEKGRVDVVVGAMLGASKHTVSCYVEVSDSGPGIREELIDLIFEPFTRSNPDGVVRGTGLGLSITRQLARAMGGDVTVSSTPGAGSTFRLSLNNLSIVPAVQLQARTGGGYRLRDLPNLRLIAVDDVELNRQVIAAMFADSAHALLLTKSGQDVLKAVRSFKPDVILIDICMDDMDGSELAQRLRNDVETSNLCLIALTAAKPYSQSSSAILFDGVLLKPFTESALATIIAQAMETTVNNTSVSIAAPVAIDATPDPELINKLRELDGRWKKLTQALTIRDARDFAAMLVRMAQQHHSAELARYGDRLEAAAQAFDVAQIERLLANFPSQVAAIERIACPEQ